MPSISLSSDQARSALGSGRARRRWFYEGDPAVLEFSSLNGKDRFEGSQSGKDCVSFVSCDGLGEVAHLPTGQGAVLWVLGMQIQLIAGDRDHLRK